MDKDFLRAGNPRKIISCYNNLLGMESISALKTELDDHVKAIYALALNHFQFAERQRNTEWRQKVSRYYYACYNASKALRFHMDGNFSSDVTDHKKIGDLPDDFPNKEYFKNKIESMRTDRNSCDYDHQIAQDDLIDSPESIRNVSTDFLEEVQIYCNNRGLALTGN